MSKYREDPRGTSDQEAIINQYLSEPKEYVIDSTRFNPVKIVRDCFVGFLFSVTYITNDNRKRCCLFFVGFSTLVIVVLVLSQLRNAFRKAPYIFLTISEGTTGEADLYMLPRFTNDSQNPLLNFTDLERKLENEDLLRGIAPRWMFLGNVKPRDNPDERYSGTILITDTEKEAEMRLGRKWKFRDLGENEAHVATALVKSVGIRPQHGERMLVEIHIDSFIDAITGKSASMEGGVNSGGGIGGLDIDTNEPVGQFLRDNGVNTEEEITLNFTALPFPFLPDFIRDLGVLVINTTIQEVIDNIAEQAGITTVQDVIDSLDLSFEVILVDEIDKYRGKYPSAFGNLVIMDSKYMDVLVGQLLTRNPTIGLLMSALSGTDAEIDLSEIKWDEYAMMVVGMYEKRLETYIKDTKDRTHDMIQFTNRVMDKIGVKTSLSFQTPTADGITVMDFVIMFLEQVFVGMTVCMCLLGSILIYSLLLQNVDEKTYEFGMLRAMGLLQPTLIQMIFVQVVYFSIPGMLIGLLISFVVNIPMDYLFYHYCTLDKLDLTFSWDSIVIPIGIGILIPLFANIVPIRTALSKSLRDSLDIARQSMNETKVKFIKLERMGLQAWQTTAAVVMIVMGFVVYYVLPLAFILQELKIFFYTLEFIFIGMLIGLCLLAIVFEPLLERVIVTVILHLVIVCCLPRDRRMKSLILKNLAGHRGRNRKAFLMFTITIAFIIFSGANFNMLIKTVVGNIVVFIGADVIALSTSVSYNIRTEGLINYLDEQVAVGNVTSYAFVTFPMNSYGFVRRTRFSNMAGFPMRSMDIFGISENYLEPSYDEYYIPTEKNRAVHCYKSWTSSCDLIQSLYKDEGRAHVEGLRSDYRPLFLQTGIDLDVSDEELLNYDPGRAYRENYDILMSEAMRDFYGVDSESPVLLNVQKFHGSYYKSIAIPHGTVRKMPGFFFSSYGISAMGSPVLMSIHQYTKLLEDTYDQIVERSIERNEPIITKYKYSGEISYWKLAIEIGDDNDEEKRFWVKNGMRVHLDPDFSMVQDTEEIKRSASGATIGFTSIFYTGGVLSLVFCTYMLFLSFVGNVRDNQWVFGVLRATGFPVNMLIRAYIYEAVALVIAAFCLGLIIGIIIASTLILQFNLFIEMPFQFHFPYDMVFTMGGLAVVLAVLGSYLPARRIKKMEIAQVLRGLE